MLIICQAILKITFQIPINYNCSEKYVLVKEFKHL